LLSDCFDFFNQYTLPRSTLLVPSFDDTQSL